MQLEDPLINNDRVACVNAALVANNDIGGPAQKIGDLAFPLVTPLSSDDDNVGQGHCGPKPRICTIRESLRCGVRPSKR